MATSLITVWYVFFSLCVSVGLSSANATTAWKTALPLVSDTPESRPRPPTTDPRQNVPPALDLARRKAEEELVTGPMASHRRRAGDRHWWLLWDLGQHPTEDFDFPGVVFKLSAQRPGPSSMVEAHPEVLTMPKTWTVITGRTWESLVAVKVAAAKGSSYAMLTTVHKIHKAVIGGDQGSWPEGQKSKRKRKTEQEL